MPTPPFRQIRAHYDARTITVYQAYSPAIADAALAAGRFVPPFKRDRMTWIKPSFLWMMYRCGWATKPGQERVLAIRMSRAGFEDALSRSALSHPDPGTDRSAWRAAVATSPVRIQWDPERDTQLRALPWRSIQIGLGGDTVNDYVENWIVDLTDITHQVRNPDGSPAVPHEKPYPLAADIAARIGARERPTT